MENSRGLRSTRQTMLPEVVERATTAILAVSCGSGGWCSIRIRLRTNSSVEDKLGFRLASKLDWPNVSLFDFPSPTTSVISNLKAASYAIDPASLWRCVSSDGVAEKFTSLSQCPYTNGRSRVLVYGDLSPSSLREMIFVGVVLFHIFFSILSSRWLRRQHYPHVRILTLVFA